MLQGEPPVTSLDTLRREFRAAPVPKAVEITRNERIEFKSVRDYLDALDAGGESQYYPS